MRELGNLDRRERLEVGSGRAVNKFPLSGASVLPQNGGNVVVSGKSGFAANSGKADISVRLTTERRGWSAMFVILQMRLC